MNIRPLTQLREMITAALRSQTNIGKSFQSLFIETMELFLTHTGRLNFCTLTVRLNNITLTYTPNSRRPYR